MELDLFLWSSAQRNGRIYPEAWFSVRLPSMRSRRMSSGDKKCFANRLIPHEVVLRDPGFLRPLSGIEVPNGEYSQFGAF